MQYNSITLYNIYIILIIESSDQSLGRDYCFIDTYLSYNTYLIQFFDRFFLFFKLYFKVRIVFVQFNIHL